MFGYDPADQSGELLGERDDDEVHGDEIPTSTPNDPNAENLAQSQLEDFEKRLQHDITAQDSPASRRARTYQKIFDTRLAEIKEKHSSPLPESKKRPAATVEGAPDGEVGSWKYIRTGANLCACRRRRELVGEKGQGHNFQDGKHPSSVWP